jgi:hypothetical protein
MPAMGPVAFIGKVAAFDRNAWPRSIGLHGRNRRNPQGLIKKDVRTSDAVQTLASEQSSIVQRVSSCLFCIAHFFSPGLALAPAAFRSPGAASRVARSVRSLAKRSRAVPSASLYSAMAWVPSSFCCSRQSFTSSGVLAIGVPSLFPGHTPVTCQRFPWGRIFGSS